MKKVRKENSRYQPSFSQQLAWWVQSHLESAAITLKQFCGNPVASFLGMGIFAIVMSLPVGLYWIMLNVESLIEPWQQGGQMTLFLHKNVSEIQVYDFAKRLELRPEVAKVVVISPNEALDEFNRFSGMANVVSALGENPLPTVLWITPKQLTPATLESLQNLIKNEPMVEQFQLDTAWIARLQSILAFMEKGVWVLACLLGTGLLLVTGHSIRTLVLSRAHEITIAKWVGAPDAFVRRPFLYAGFWFGLVGGVMGLVVVSLAFQGIYPALAQVLANYGTHWQLQGLSWTTQFLMIGGCAFLGTAGAWLAVTHYLFQVRPR